MEFSLYSDKACKDIQTPGWIYSTPILALWDETNCISFTELQWGRTVFTLLNKSREKMGA